MIIKQPPNIIEIKKIGCTKAIIFDFKLQALDQIDNLLSIATKHGLSMAQAANGYIEVWLDDNKHYHCQATEFSGKKKNSCTRSSLLNNNKLYMDAWLVEWWDKLNKILLLDVEKKRFANALKGLKAQAAAVSMYPPNKDNLKSAQGLMSAHDFECKLIYKLIKKNGVSITHLDETLLFEWLEKPIKN